MYSVTIMDSKSMHGYQKIERSERGKVVFTGYNVIDRYKRVPDIRIDELGNDYQKPIALSRTPVKNIRLAKAYSVITMVGCAILITVTLTLVARHWYIVQMRPKKSKQTFAEKQLNIVDPHFTHSFLSASSSNATTPNSTTNTIIRDAKNLNTQTMLYNLMSSSTYKTKSFSLATPKLELLRSGPETSSKFPLVLHTNISRRHFSKTEQQSINVSSIIATTKAYSTESSTTGPESPTTSRIYTTEIKPQLYPFPEKLIDPGCSCKDLYMNGIGNCKFPFKKCYVNQPSTCSNLAKSRVFPGEQISTEPC